MSATDVWGEEFVSERLNGEIGLYNVGEGKPSVVMQLPLGKLGGLRTFAASPDLKFLAISGRTRGGIWNLESNERVFHIREAFAESAYYAPNFTFFLDFPLLEKTGRELAVAKSRHTPNQIAPRRTRTTTLPFFGDVLFRITAWRKESSRDRAQLSAGCFGYRGPEAALVAQFSKAGPFHLRFAFQRQGSLDLGRKLRRDPR